MIERLLAPTPPVTLTEIVSEPTELTPSSIVDYDILGSNTLLLGENNCVACGLTINDESYLRVHKHGIFHENCLTCYICRQALINIGGGYFIRNPYEQKAHFICRHDYQTIHQNKCYPNSSSSSSCSSSSSFSNSSIYFHQCSKCQSMISANELVMRTDDKHIYHVDCFTCCLCNVLLKPGDDYGLHGSLLFCRLHSEQTTNTTFSLCSPIKSSPSSSMTNTNIKKSRQNSTTTSTQRKQRTKLNNLENNTNNLDMTGFLSGTDLSSSDGNYSSTLFNSSSTSNPQQRTKRNRTSFKHHQLRIMKTFFAQNHNPDSKGLKILSQKTQLSKRVLQVWFQNARAKLRRGLLQEQENKQQKASTSTENSNPTDNPGTNQREKEFLQMLTDDDLGSGTSNDRSRTEEDDLIDEFDEYDNNQNPDSSSMTTHEINHMMPPYSIYPLL